MSDVARTFTDVNWKRKGDVQDFIAQLVNDKQTYNLDVERQSQINTAWYRGHQLRWNPRTNRLMNQGNPFHRVRLIYNLMRGLVDGFNAKLALDKIRLISEPATEDIEDYDTADLQTKVLQYYQQAHNQQGLVDATDVSAVLTGEAFVKVVWDAQKGSEFDITPSDFDISAEDFDQEFGKELRGLQIGELSVSEIPIYNIWWGPRDTEFDQKEYLLEIYERSVASIMERYGLKAEQIKPEVDRSAAMWRHSRTNNYGSVVNKGDEAVTLVKELWVKPNKTLKGLARGRHAILIGDQLVKNEPNPYNHQRIPIVRRPFMIVPGETRGDTFVNDLLAPQMNVNKTVSQFAENRELMANPTWLAREASIVDENEWNSHPGGIRTYRGEMPELKQGASMPNAVMQMFGSDLKIMQDIVGLRDVSQGKNPPGVRSGTGLAMLKEADDERMGRIAMWRRRFWMDIGRLELQVVNQYVTEDRIIRIAGDESESETATFNGSMLTGKRRNTGVEYFNVSIKTRGLPQSRSARIDEIDRALECGALNPAQDPYDKETVLDALELAVGRRDLSQKRKARRLQHKRNLKMAKGEYVPPDIHEDLDALSEELSWFWHEPFFPELPTKGLFEQYEEEVVGLMALRQYRLKMIAQKALAKVGGAPAEPEISQKSA